MRVPRLFLFDDTCKVLVEQEDFAEEFWGETGNVGNMGVVTKPEMERAIRVVG